VTSPAPTSDATFAAAPLQSEVAKRADFDRIRYAQSWEDPECLRGALRPDRSSTILSIAAAGDNSFALLLQGAGRVVSVDMSPAQCALVELKRAAIRVLEHEELLRFVGALPSRDRGAVYARVRRELPDDARAWWDLQPELVARGIIHVGKLEDMWRIFRTRVHPLLHGPRTTRAAFESRTRLARQEFWHERWNNLRWRTVLRMFFSETVIARLGRDPSFFEHVQVDVGRHYAGRAYHAFVELDPSRNPFLQYILFGRYLDLENGHPWLAPQHHGLLRDRLDDLEVVCAEIEQHLGDCEPGTYTGFNLSDIFEWMSDELHERVYRAIVRSSTPGAKIAYWNNLVPRSAPQPLLQAGAVTTDRELAMRLHDADRAFLYRDFHVDTVVDPEGC
jgi:S-adenosylmethionine-diacylglycerol 3-amino-3-carboxypropyl transferase